MEKKSLEIGVNMMSIRRGQSGGIRQHLIGLINDTLAEDPGLSLTCFVSRLSKIEDDFNNHRVHFKEILSPEREIEAQYKHGVFDVLFGGVADIGLNEPIAPAVTLIPDLQHEDLPDNFTPETIERRRRRWHWSALASQRVCVSSEFVRESLIKHLGIPNERIVLTPPSLPTCFISGPSPEAISTFEALLKPKLPDRFLFYPANTWPHKNHHRLIEALALLKGGNAPHLLLTGWPMSAHRRLHRQIAKLGLVGRVHWTGYVPDDWMPLLYRASAGVVFPSLYEGYGIPLLEALYSDCPIICSDTTACPEIVGNAALMFDPGSVGQIAEAMACLWNSKSIANELVERSQHRRANFDHKTGGRNLAKALHAAYDEFTNVPTRWRWSDEPRLIKGLPVVNAPLVSIITPSFQQGEFIAATIESILQQDYPNYELIVIDGGSTDGTVEILKSYGERIRWVSEIDQGQADAINKGLDLAKGDIIGWLNSDDIYLEGAISKAVAAIQKSSGALLVYGEALYINKEGKTIGRYATQTASVANLLTYCVICQPTVFFSRRLIKQAGKLDTTFHMAMDYELWLRFSKITTFLFIPEYLAASRMYTENKTMRHKKLSVQESMRACRRHYFWTSNNWRRQYALAAITGFGRIGTVPLVKKTTYILYYSFALLCDVFKYLDHRLVRFCHRHIAQCRKN